MPMINSCRWQWQNKLNTKLLRTSENVYLPQTLMLASGIQATHIHAHTLARTRRVDVIKRMRGGRVCVSLRCEVRSQAGVINLLCKFWRVEFVCETPLASAVAHKCARRRERVERLHTSRRVCIMLASIKNKYKSVGFSCI